MNNMTLDHVQFILDDIINQAMDTAESKNEKEKASIDLKSSTPQPKAREAANPLPIKRKPTTVATPQPKASESSSPPPMKRKPEPKQAAAQAASKRMQLMKKKKATTTACPVKRKLKSTIEPKATVPEKVPRITRARARINYKAMNAKGKEN